MPRISTDIGTSGYDVEELLHNPSAEHMALARKYQAKYGSPITGYTRATFIDRDTHTVIKLQLRQHSNYTENVDEANTFAKHPEWPLATCWMEPSEFDSTVDVLRMDLVDTEFVYGDDDSGRIHRWDDAEEHLPRWASCLDSAQVGMTLEGKLVAYDYPQLAVEYTAHRFMEALDD